MLLNTKPLLIATKELVFFFDPKSVHNLLHRMFFNMVYARFLLMKMLGTR